MKKENDKGIKILCAVLFLLFSFCWFGFFQGDLMKAAFSSLTHQTFTYYRIPAALILSCLLILPVIPSKLLLKFHGGSYAANYVTSALLVGALSGFDGEHFFSQTAGQWITAAVVCLAILLLCRVLSTARTPMGSSTRRYAGAFAVMIILLVTAVGLGNTDENFHRRLTIERLMNDGKFEKALSVGRFEEESDRSVAWLRAQSMLNLESDVEGSAIGELLFAYPVPDARDLARKLESVDDTTGNAAVSSLLLKRDIDGLVTALSGDRLADWQNLGLPRYYMQAIVIASSMGYDISDAAQLLYPEQYKEEQERYLAFCGRLDGLKSQPRQYAANSLYIDFHETYYWFFEFCR